MAKKTKKEQIWWQPVVYSGSAQKLLDIAGYYGFSAISPTEVGKKDSVKEILHADPWQQKNCQRPITPTEEKIALLRTFIESDQKPGLPVFLAEIKKGKKNQEAILTLSILGSSKSISEALLITTAWQILKENGYKNISLLLTSMGDKESSASFTRDITNYFKKNLDGLCANCRQAFKKESAAPFACLNNSCKEIVAAGPKSIDFLSEESRAHFTEVLEAVETLDLPYQVDGTIIENRMAASGTLIEVRDSDNVLLAKGSRFDQLAKRANIGKKMPAVSISLLVKKMSGVTKPKLLQKATAAPTCYLIELGNAARNKALILLEILRAHKISVAQQLFRDGLSTQLASAERSGAKVALIIGQREVIENSVIVRNLESRSQTTIKVADLIPYLKSMKTK